MNITHICLCGPFTEGFSYQDNLLPKYHVKNGHHVSLITSEWIWSREGKLIKDNKNQYINQDGIQVHRLRLKGRDDFNKKIKSYSNVYETIQQSEPDILFVHGVQFVDIKNIIRYKRNNPETKVFVDNHADFSNSARNFLSKNVLHKVLWRLCAKAVEPYTSKFYGVLPARVDFLHTMYKIPKEKIQLLVMGADDDDVEVATKSDVINETRIKYGIKKEEFLIVTGGKIDKSKKQILMLIDALKEIPNRKLKLIIFGSIDHDLINEVNSRIDGCKIQYIGWISSLQSYNIMAAADLLVFPGRHSVYWEQAVALGVPLIVKFWQGTTHINIGGNCKFIYSDTISEIKNTIEEVTENPKVYQELRIQARKSERRKFLYSNISVESIKV